MQEKYEIIVKGQKVEVLNVNGNDYISITDMLKSKDGNFFVTDWLRNRNTIEFLGVWEKLHNPDFNYGEFAIIKSHAGLNSYKLSAKEWVEKTNAIGIVSKAGRYGGTYAHKDIAFEFGMWISPEFKLLLIMEFERLKKKEAEENKIEWSISRTLTKINYLLQTESIKNNIVPLLTEKQKKYVYASEADVLNVALFGITAKEWRKNNPNLEGNIRDNTDILHLVILNNLENINSEMIEMKVSQSTRLIKLNEIARRQMNLLSTNSSLNNLKYIDNSK